MLCEQQSSNPLGKRVSTKTMITLDVTKRMTNYAPFA
jgi:hypothetical protein